MLDSFVVPSSGACAKAGYPVWHISMPVCSYEHPRAPGAIETCVLSSGMGGVKNRRWWESMLDSLSQARVRKGWTPYPVWHISMPVCSHACVSIRGHQEQEKFVVFLVVWVVCQESVVVGIYA